jgi:hypothetical protein
VRELLSSLVERIDIVGAFAKDHSAFLFATLRMNREQQKVALDVGHEAPHFEIIA